MADKTNIEQRIRQAQDLKASLEEKLEKVKGSPREDDFRLQIEKLEALIGHLEGELEG